MAPFAASSLFQQIQRRSDNCPQAVWKRNENSYCQEQISPKPEKENIWGDYLVYSEIWNGKGQLTLAHAKKRQSAEEGGV